MSLIIATGSNLGRKDEHLKEALNELKKHFSFVAQSKVYKSKAIEYVDQPSFYNQVLEFKLPENLSAEQTMDLLLEIEKNLGRTREIQKGPRIIDLDIIFWGLERYQSNKLIVPHPSWNKRSFVVYPLLELPYFQTLKNHFIIPNSFDNFAEPIN